MSAVLCGIHNCVRMVGPRRSALALAVVLAVVFGVLLLIYVDRTYLDPGGRGMAGEANDKCAVHEGVRYMNAQQGTIICRDGWAVE